MKKINWQNFFVIASHDLHNNKLIVVKRIHQIFRHGVALWKKIRILFLYGQYTWSISYYCIRMEIDLSYYIDQNWKRLPWPTGYPCPLPRVERTLSISELSLALFFSARTRTLPTTPYSVAVIYSIRDLVNQRYLKNGTMTSAFIISFWRNNCRKKGDWMTGHYHMVLFLTFMHSGRSSSFVLTWVCNQNLFFLRDNSIGSLFRTCQESLDIQWK